MTIRIVSGKHKGRSLYLPDGYLLRPTGGRAREAIFNMLVHGGDAELEGAQVADVCCGTGWFGFEALSRGAVGATFVDNRQESLEAVRKTADKLGEIGNVDLVRSDALALPFARREYNIIFVDPPYGKGLLPGIIKALKEKRWLADDALVICEHSVKEKLPEIQDFEVIEDRKYGETGITFLRHSR